MPILPTMPATALCLLLTIVTRSRIWASLIAGAYLLTENFIIGMTIGLLPRMDWIFGLLIGEVRYYWLGDPRLTPNPPKDGVWDAC